MHLPSTPNKQGLESVHDGGEHRVEEYRPSEGDFNIRVEHLHGHRVPQETRDKSETKHKRKRQCHGAAKDDHRHDVNVGVKHPVERRDEDLDNLRDENEHDEDEEKNHDNDFDIRILDFPPLLAPNHDEDVLKLRQVDSRDELGLGIEAADLKAADGPDKKPGGKDAADA